MHRPMSRFTVGRRDSQRGQTTGFRLFGALEGLVKIIQTDMEAGTMRWISSGSPQARFPKLAPSVYSGEEAKAASSPLPFGAFSVLA